MIIAIIINKKNRNNTYKPLDKKKTKLPSFGKMMRKTAVVWN